MIKLKLRNFDKYFKYNLHQTDYDTIVYTDTDSVFISLEKFIKNGKNEKDLIKEIENSTINIGKEFAQDILKNDKYIENFDNLLLRIRFKNEYLLKNVIFYAKKKYLGIKINKDGSFSPVMTGVEGKKNTSKFIKQIVDDLINYLIEIEIGKEDFSSERLYKLYKHYENQILSIRNFSEAIELLGLPLNITKNVDDLKSVQSQYRGTIVFDVLTEEILKINFWEENKSGKGVLLYIDSKKIDLIYVEKIINKFKSLEKIKLNLEKNDPREYIEAITVPADFINDKEILSKLENDLIVDYERYIDILRQKFNLMYSVLNEEFCDKLVSEKTRKQNMIFIKPEQIMITNYNK